MKERIKVLVYACQTFQTVSYKRLLERSQIFTVTVTDTLTSANGIDSWDIVIIDVDENNSALKQILNKIAVDSLTAKVLMLTINVVSEDVINGLLNGASGCISKNWGERKVIHAVEAFHKNGFCFDAETFRGLFYCSREQMQLRLSGLENKIYDFMKQGLSEQDIAERLEIKKNTVHAVKSRIKKKQSDAKLNRK